MARSVERIISQAFSEARISSIWLRKALGISVLAGGYFFLYLTASIFQERTWTRCHGNLGQFNFPVFVNIIESLFNALAGATYIYLYGAPKGLTLCPPKTTSLVPLLFIALASNSGSQFGNSALKYVDYSALIVSKSCMLLPIVTLNVAFLGKRFPVSRHLLFVAVTSGLLLVTLQDLPNLTGIFLAGKSELRGGHIWGLQLLLINIYLESSAYIVQEYLIGNPGRYGDLRGPRMMVFYNLTAAFSTALFLLVAHFIPKSLLPELLHKSSTELSSVINFIRQSPEVLLDVFGYTFLGSASALLIFATFLNFSSLVHMNIRVVRKTLVMLMSIVWFQKSLTFWQYLGSVLIFGGAAVEALIQRNESRRIEEERPKVE